MVSPPTVTPIDHRTPPLIDQLHTFPGSDAGRDASCPKGCEMCRSTGFIAVPSVSEDGINCGYRRLQVIVEQVELADPVDAWNIDFITALRRVVKTAGRVTNVYRCRFCDRELR
jgi:hypothetical protein